MFKVAILPRHDARAAELQSIVAAEALDTEQGQERQQSLPLEDQLILGEVTAWPEFLQDSFACEPLFKLMKGNPKRAALACQEWLAHDEGISHDDGGSGGMSAGSIETLAQIKSFCQGYLAIVGTSPMTGEMHAAMKLMFYPSKGQKNKWLSTMAIAANS